MKYLLDTNICIYIINNKPSIVYSKFREIHLENLFISSITEFELRYGVEKSVNAKRNLKQLNEFISFFNLIPFSGEESIFAAEIKYSLEKKGNIIGPYDILIAAQALAHNLTLVTNNLKEFKRVPGLKTENWVKA